MFLFQLKIEEGEKTLTKQTMEKELNNLLSSKLGVREGVAVLDHISFKNGKLVEGENAITIKFVNIPKSRMREIALSTVAKINEMLSNTPYGCEGNMMIWKPLVSSKEEKDPAVKAYLRIGVYLK